jgi:hypothetical protein
MAKRPVYGGSIPSSITELALPIILVDDNMTKMKSLTPEQLCASNAYDCLSQAEKVAVHLRYGKNIMKWWREKDATQ